jgi:bifunctional DNA-binding transcriptional regulator/antitoxin component of YhaV-PrlF toxin-antitoxin module
MANWVIKLDVADIWEKYQDDEDFDEFKEALIPRLEDKVEEVVDELGDGVGMEFEDMIEEIKNADDVEEFDYVWQDMYDWADANMVWLGTF